MESNFDKKREYANAYIKRELAGRKGIPQSKINKIYRKAWKEAKKKYP